MRSGWPIRTGYLMPEREEGGPEGDDDEEDEEAEAAFRQQMGLPEVSNPSTAVRTEYGAVCLFCVPVGQVPLSVARHSGGHSAGAIILLEKPLGSLRLLICAVYVCNKAAHARRSKEGHLQSIDF